MKKVSKPNNIRTFAKVISELNSLKSKNPKSKKMKKIIFAASLFAAFSLTNCKNKAENPAPTTGKAIIKGVATVDLDQTVGGRQGAIPDGTKVVVVVSTENLVSSPTTGATYDKNTYSGVIAAGAYSIEIDAISKPSTVTMYAEAFEATVTFAVAPAPVLSERRKFATITRNNVNVYKGGVFIEDFNY